MPPNEKSCETCGNISHSKESNPNASESKIILPKRKNKITNPYVRDVFLSYLTRNAERTVPDGYPVIEDWMVAQEVPQFMLQWDCRHEIVEPSKTAMSFYCKDENFTPVLNNPHLYINKLKRYQCVVGMDASPYDNMQPVVQNSQVFTNLAITYFFGLCGLKIIPNIRLGLKGTYASLDAIPKHCIISVGTNGFIKTKENRKIFADQIKVVAEVLRPKTMLVYGKDCPEIFDYPKSLGIEVFQYDSHTMKRNLLLKKEGR